MNLPPSHKGMGFTALAGYLVSTHQARDYPQACSMLAKLRRKPRKKPAAIYAPRSVRLPYADL